MRKLPSAAARHDEVPREWGELFRIAERTPGPSCQVAGPGSHLIAACVCEVCEALVEGHEQMH